MIVCKFLCKKCSILSCVKYLDKPLSLNICLFLFLFYTLQLRWYSWFVREEVSIVVSDVVENFQKHCSNYPKYVCYYRNCFKDQEIWKNMKDKRKKKSPVSIDAPKLETRQIYAEYYGKTWHAVYQKKSLTKKHRNRRLK